MTLSTPVGPMKYCHACGGTIEADARACTRCGAKQVMTTSSAPESTVSPKSRLVALLLCFFFGVFGVHRFYAGKIGTGIVQLLTLGGLGIWATVDFIMIILGAFTDKEGRKIKSWGD